MMDEPCCCILSEIDGEPIGGPCSSCLLRLSIGHDKKLRAIFEAGFSAGEEWGGKDLYLRGKYTREQAIDESWIMFVEDV